ncbi:MAG: putative molybdenum carrier protein [Bacteroidia bacterium]|nr:putative molybdenum carrier protein [Bacteroidia bacterium]
MTEKIISGGQTGVDRAALDWALEKDVACGGWCPKGRIAEDGIIPEKYPLQETQTDQVEERTLKNLSSSDGTLVITLDQPTGGTAFTLESAYEMGKPFFLYYLGHPPRAGEIQKWIEQHQIRTLNIAGPRESEVPEIYMATLLLLDKLAENEIKFVSHA